MWATIFKPCFVHLWGFKGNLLMVITRLHWAFQSPKSSTLQLPLCWPEGDGLKLKQGPAKTKCIYIYMLYVCMYACMHACIACLLACLFVCLYVHSITLHYITLHFITLHYITFILHYIPLHYRPLHIITLHTITLHYITFYVTLHYPTWHYITYTDRTHVLYVNTSMYIYDIYKSIKSWNYGFWSPIAPSPFKTSVFPLPFLNAAERLEGVPGSTAPGETPSRCRIPHRKKHHHLEWIWMNQLSTNQWNQDEIIL
jgi:hypothetical protein